MEVQPVVEEGIQAAYDEVMARVVADDEIESSAAPVASRLGVLHEVVDGRRDTVTAACQDHDHFPGTDEPCRASFLTCFTCRNAVVLKRHLPRIMALVDHLNALRAVTPATVWESRFAVHLARASSLTEPGRYFSNRDVDGARAVVTEDDRLAVKRLMAREWDE
ncbi:hypothetical protein [Nesterenkonia salmonea]|uniref:hypothetical protein n=1 Tax=Nesterenkonia salmonea TaxID=1804987 RepID=UPI0010FE8FBF|nr:hypothetical protein [Nesterenkonia salmonea]